MLNLPILAWLYFGLVVPTWDALESKLPTSLQPEPNVYLETDLLNDDETSNSLNGQLVLYRDANAICPYAQQVWLALELKQVEYHTVLLDNDDDDDDETTIENGESSLKLQWPDGTVQTDAREILERIQSEYSDLAPNLFDSRMSVAVDPVRCNMDRFLPVFPRNTRPDKYAPFLFQKETGELTPRSTHMVTLEETDEILEEYDDGPFLCGDTISAADLTWGPFLERYSAQLPLLFPNDDALDPRSKEYPNIRAWHDAMEALIPCYSCRVGGDAVSWGKVLAMGLAASKSLDNASGSSSSSSIKMGENSIRRVKPNRRRGYDPDAIWKKYAKDKPHLAATPAKECVAQIVKKRDLILRDAKAKIKSTLTEEDLDAAIREVCQAILELDDKDGKKEENLLLKLSGNARRMASFIHDWILVPRDMGMIPARKLREVVALAPEPRIL